MRNVPRPCIFLNDEEITRSLRQHRELIVNYSRAQKLISSGVGVVEGLDNKAKVTMRKS